MVEDDFYEVYEEDEEEDSSKCRLCGEEEKNKYLINIFGKTGRKHALDIKIRKCLPIVVRPDDGMPKCVCLPCVNKLDVSSDLVDTVLRAQNTFLSVMTHDPARAKSERYLPAADEEEETYDEESSTAIDAGDNGLEELSDSVSTPQIDDYEMPVVIKDEPMDFSEEMREPERNLSGHSWADSAQQAPTEQQMEEAGPSTEKESDALSNVVVSSVSSIAASPPPLQSQAPTQPTDEVTMSEEDRLLEDDVATGVTDDFQVPPNPSADKTGSSQLDTQQHAADSTRVTIKTEPLGSPPHEPEFGGPSQSYNSMSSRPTQSLTAPASMAEDRSPAQQEESLQPSSSNGTFTNDPTYL